MYCARRLPPSPLPLMRIVAILSTAAAAFLPYAACDSRLGDRPAWNTTSFYWRWGRRMGLAGRVNTCPGTSLGFTLGGNVTTIMSDYKAMYTNCTYVLGNLEIVLPPDDRTQFDFSFLSGIREVKGYVLVRGTSMQVLPLNNLTIVRGEQLIADGQLGSMVNYSVLIQFNTQLRYLQLSSLKEISNGNVGLIFNEALSCHTYSSIDWQYLFSLDSQSVQTQVTSRPTLCNPSDTCHASCETKMANGTAERHCWGPLSDHCQLVIRCSPECQPSSGGSSGANRNQRRKARCFGTEYSQCCHPECVGSCTGPYDHSCLACRNFKNDNQCVPSCPDPMVYDTEKYQFVDNPNKRYALGAFCVRRCPDNYAVFNKGCVISCPSGYASNADGVCEKCSGPCPKDCVVDFDADKDLFVNADNIMTLANCTRVTGNLAFSRDVFEPPRFDRKRRAREASRALTLSDLDVLRTIKVVTGYVFIQASEPWLTNMEFLGNLEEISGTKLRYNRYALEINMPRVAYLGLKSLQRVKEGAIHLQISSNCYTTQAALQSIVSFRYRNAVVVVGRPCNESLCDRQCKDTLCWGPGAGMCLRCAGYASADGKTCVTSCRGRSGEYEPPNAQPGLGLKCGLCHPECSPTSNCTGPTDGDCGACRNYKDGPFCRATCPQREKYPDANNQCQACHSYCRDGCTGNSSAVGSGKKGCRNCFAALIQIPSTIFECIKLDEANPCPRHYFNSTVLRKPVPQEHIGTTHFCIPCDKQCDTCSFYGAEQCLTCVNVELSVSNEADPESETVVHCAPACPALNYEVRLPARVPGPGARPRRVCRPCSSLCLDGCRGPDASDCFRCKDKRLYANGTSSFTCVDKCPEEAQYTRKDENDQDVCSYTDPAAERITIAEKRNVPAIIGGVIGGFVILLGAAIAIACVCRQRAAAREKSRRYELKIINGAVSSESLNLTDAPPDLARLRLIKESEIQRGNMIGSGAFGTVYKGLWLPEGEGVTIPVAIKVLQAGTTPEQNKELLEEARIMATVRHPCCVPLIAVCLTSPMMLLTQLMPNGCLLEYIRKNKANIGSKTLLDWSAQIAKGMEYLEGRGIVHRDLAARNVLVQNSSQVKITDFGLAKVLDYNSDQYEASGGKMPIKWMALESIQQRIFTHKTDVWSYGVTLWELFTYGQRPYDGVRAYDIPQLLERGERLSQPSICTIDVYMIMIKCWMLDADSRPSFSDLVADFGRMSKDPGRYLVIAGDRLMKLSSVAYTARDFLEDDTELAATVAEHGGKIVELDDYLQPATVGTTATSDGSGTSALDRVVADRANVEGSSAPLLCNAGGKGSGEAAPRSRSVDSRYGPSPSRHQSSSTEADDPAAQEHEPFLPAVDEAGYLQPQQSTPTEDYLNPAPAQSQYLDVIPEDDLGFAKRSSGAIHGEPTSTATAGDNRQPVCMPAAKVVGANIDNPEYYIGQTASS